MLADGSSLHPVTLPSRLVSRSLPRSNDSLLKLAASREGSRWLIMADIVLVGRPGELIICSLRFSKNGPLPSADESSPAVLRMLIHTQINTE
jgi:hypothetical protein